MSKKCILLGIFGFSLLIGIPKIFADSYEPLSIEEAAMFQGQLEQLVQKAEKKVKELQQNATRKDVAPTWTSKVELQNGIVQLEVKKTLVNNFKGTESLQSPKVRQKLMEILNKPDISTADLAELQNLVLDEKAKIHAAKME